MKRAGAVNMGEAIEQIDLTSALTLAAFGVELSGENFAQELNARHFGHKRDTAFKKLTNALEKLQNRVVAGDLVLMGKFVEAGKAPDAIKEEQIDPHALRSFGAFDYQINGLRFGERQLLWFSVSDEPYRTPTFARTDHYRDVTVARGQIRKFLGRGTSKYRVANTKERLPDDQLETWYSSLSAEQRSLSQVELHQLAKEQHPDHTVVRDQIRKVVTKRARGRPKSKKIKTAD